LIRVKNLKHVALWEQNNVSKLTVEIKNTAKSTQLDIRTKTTKASVAS